MKKIQAVLILIFILTYSITGFAQRSDPKNLIDKLGRTANAYFLSANRPTYTISAFNIDKGTYELSLDPTFNNNSSEIPITLTYGLSKKVELFTGIDMYNQTYRFDGAKTSGVGDANIGVMWAFQNSKHFTHSFTALVKIPTASAQTQVGTGHPDYHFGIGEGYSAKKFEYELTLEFGLLHRRNLPGENKPTKFFTQQVLDSIRTQYDYNFEPEITLAFTPSYYFSDKFLIYTGGGFTRNTKLDYNTSMIFGGFGYMPSEIVSITLGVSDGFGDGSNWLAYTGAAFTFK